MTGAYGLSERDWELILHALHRFPEIDRAVLFGSRALGTNEAGSDVDLAVIGEQMTHETVAGLSDLLNEVTPLPYMFDICDYGAITNPDLKQQIDKSGQEIYRSQ